MKPIPFLSLLAFLCVATGASADSPPHLYSTLRGNDGCYQIFGYGRYGLGVIVCVQGSYPGGSDGANGPKIAILAPNKHDKFGRLWCGHASTFTNPTSGTSVNQMGLILEKTAPMFSAQFDGAVDDSLNIPGLEWGSVTVQWHAKAKPDPKVEYVRYRSWTASVVAEVFDSPKCR